MTSLHEPKTAWQLELVFGTHPSKDSPLAYRSANCPETERENSGVRDLSFQLYDLKSNLNANILHEKGKHSEDFYPLIPRHTFVSQIRPTDSGTRDTEMEAWYFSIFPQGGVGM